LALLVREVAAADRLDRRVAALNQVIIGKYGYDGDRLTYEDLQNANLMRVIDRRKGLPIALGILYLHAARAQGWEAHGLAFPGHFLIRLDGDGRRVILDPFNRGRTCDTPALRGLLKAATGLDAELEPAHYAPVGNRSILLRLQNNIKLRLIRDRCWARALEVVEAMLLFAPGEPQPWREASILSSRLGHLGRAVECLQTSLEHQPGDAARHATATLLQRLRKQLN
jgi:regulator of sirC expression with transglutaminase-like and TPR domain